MSIINLYGKRNSIRNNAVIDDSVYFSQNILSVKRKLGTPKNAKKSVGQTTLEYEKTIQGMIFTAFYSFDNSKLSSIRYESGVLTDDEMKNYINKIKNSIAKSGFDSIMNFTHCEKDCWELSDGEIFLHICLYKKINKLYIKIEYSNL
ncbi:MAG: hypothetical protein LIO62_04560 [Clostridiales bacterium]|nr:hypothetical protein [Clostridiales bacterium]